MSLWRLLKKRLLEALSGMMWMRSSGWALSLLMSMRLLNCIISILVAMAKELEERSRVGGDRQTDGTPLEDGNHLAIIFLNNGR